MIPTHNQVWESEFQDSSPLFYNDADILRAKWTCLRAPSWWMVILWFKPESAFLRMPGIIFSFCHFLPEVRCLWLPPLELFGCKSVIFSRGEFTGRHSGLLEPTGILKSGLGKGKQGCLVPAQVLRWSGKTSCPTSLPLWFRFQFQEEVPDRPDLG